MIEQINLRTPQFELVKDFLDKEMDPAYRMRGRNYFNNHSVIDIKVLKNGQAVEGIVQGTRSYITRINFNDNDTKIKTKCSCPIKEDCKHVAAVIYQMLDGNHNIKESGGENNGLEKYSKEAKSNNKTTINNPTKTNTIEAKPMPSRANLWRPIVLRNQVDLGNLIRNSKKLIRKYLYFTEPKITYTHDEILHISASAYIYEPKISIELRKKDDGWQIKCNSCSEVVEHLCLHQVGLLEDNRVHDKMVAFIKNDLTFNEFVARHFNITTAEADEIKENFKIINDGHQFYLDTSKADVILSDTKLFSKTESSIDLLDEEQLESKLKKEVAVDTFKNGLCFYETGEVIIIEGKTNKQVTKIISKITESRFPEYANSEELVFYQKLRKLTSNHSNKNQIKGLLIKNRELLSNIFMYYDETGYRNYKAISRSDLSILKFSDRLLKLMVTIKQDKVFTELKLVLVDHDVKGQLPKSKYELVEINKIEWMCPYFVFYEGEGHFLENSDTFYFINELKTKDSIKYFNMDKDLHASMIKKLSAFASFNVEDMATKVNKDAQKQIFIRLVGEYLLFEPKLSFEEETISLLRQTSFLDTDLHVFVTYDEQEIADYKAIMAALHPDWTEENAIFGMFQISKKEVEGSSWFFNFFQKCNDFGIELFGQEVISSLNFSKHKGKVSTNVTSGIDWFEAKVEMSFGDLKVDQKQWVEAIKNNEKFVKLNDGTMGLIPEQWINKLKRLVSIAEIGSDGLQISKMKFNIIDELFEEIDNKSLIEEINQKKAALINYEKNKKYVLPTNKNVVLRPYQKQGYQWLKFLEEFGFGGCLADDMGLGKTVQVITFLLDQKKANAGSSLIVVPKSLLFNWEAELKKFAPSITYHLYHGSQRNLNINEIPNYDLIISTYDTVANDISMFKNFTFNYIVLDESQAIKNIASQRYKAMRLLASRNKIVMTGTPIENNTFDLYAQMSFLNPGLLGSAAGFKNNFANPIDGLGDIHALETLKKVIHPFLLRRTKDLVAKELPEKSENIILCEMGTEQRKMYDALKLKIKEDIATKVEQDGTAKSKFMILDGLLRLRQICNSPTLVDKTLPARKKQSVKIDTLIELLEEDLGTHKALVYSQFVGMLTLIRERLDEKGIKYAYLDGSTNDRGKAVSEFMDVVDCHVFLLSIKAGNAGLNLTKADYVYIVDPWWNPAVEAQAIDRTHRIGQSNNVFAYRMICKDTIEEKIVELQKKKRKLATDLVQTDENVFKSLEKDELLSLFD